MKSVTELGDEASLMNMTQVVSETLARITLRHLQVLAYLRDHPDTAGTVVGRALGIGKSGIHIILPNSERRGLVISRWVEIEVSGRAGRPNRHLYTISELGAEVLSQALRLLDHPRLGKTITVTKCLRCGHQHYAEDECDSLETPWGSCRECECTRPVYEEIA